MNRIKNLHKVVFALGFVVAAILFLLIMLPGHVATVNSQSSFTVENNTDRAGSDYKNFDLGQPKHELCRDACANDSNCKAYTYVRPGVQGSNARCWLKSSVPAPAASSCCISGVKSGSGSGGKTGYLGCYKDTNKPFDLDGLLERSQNNTPQRCAETCRAKGFKFSGVQYGESCLCGDSYGRYGKADNCNMKCTGDSGQICGGAYANSVYGTGVSGN